MARAISAWARGAHPQVAGVPSMVVDPERHVWRGAYAADGRFSLGREKRPTETPAEKLSEAPAERLSEGEAVVLMEALDAPLSQPRAIVCADDYNWWRGHGYSPAAGKPLWLTLDDETTHHIFFDDNIHNDPTDSIVAVRARATSSSGTFAPLSGDATCRLQGIHLVRVPALEPILDRDWFVDQIFKCESERAMRFGTVAHRHALINES